MQRHRSRGTVTTAVDASDETTERKIQRLRLTLRPGDPSSEEFEGHTTSTGPDSSDSGTPAFSSPQQHDGKLASDPYRRRNGYVQPGGPVGTEDTDQHTAPAVNGLMEKPSQRSAVVGGGVPGADTDTQQGVMAHEWTVSHLRDEMNYIRAVRDSLEKVRERMYGQFGGMQQSMQKMSQDIKAANAQRQDLEAQVRVRTTAMESLDQMNSSLLSDNISLQKSLLENCLDRVEKQDELKTLRSTCRQAETKLWERERELASARAENQALRLQIESSQEASSQALQEMSERLQRGHDERLQEEQRRHREEIEALQAQIDNYVKRLEEAEMKVRTAEAKIAEKDKRISEVERLLDCMGQEKSHLLVKLQDCEQRLHILEQETDRVDETVFNKSQKLEDEAAELRERIKHLNDMVFCQQRKVKAMIEEVEILRATVAEKDLFITELLDRIAAAESKNNAKRVETKDVGVGCDLPVRPEAQPPDELQATPVRWSPRLTNRMESSLLRYSPKQYSLMLQSRSSQTTSAGTSPVRSAGDPQNPAQPSPPQQTSVQPPPGPSVQETAHPPPSNPGTTSSPAEPFSPIKKLYDITEHTEAE
uniref:Myocardial zonula adherens protein n=1 Tax=Paramormyrops kingsleyae TaxID=1676925 RepID=A0A3B3QJC3_9TELE